MTLPGNYKDYPKHVKINGMLNIMICTRCGNYEQMFCGPLDDFMSLVQSFAASHEECSNIAQIKLEPEEWAELMSALISKAALVERGDYGRDLLQIHEKLAKQLEENGISY